MQAAARCTWRKIKEKPYQHGNTLRTSTLSRNGKDRCDTTCLASLLIGDGTSSDSSTQPAKDMSSVYRQPKAHGTLSPLFGHSFSETLGNSAWQWSFRCVSMRRLRRRAFGQAGHALISHLLVSLTLSRNTGRCSCSPGICPSRLRLSSRAGEDYPTWSLVPAHLHSNEFGHQSRRAYLILLEVYPTTSHWFTCTSKRSHSYCDAKQQAASDLPLQ